MRNLITIKNKFKSSFFYKNHPSFHFILFHFLQPEWMKTKEYWDKDFENRYEKLMKDTARPPLKVTRLFGNIFLESEKNIYFF